MCESVIREPAPPTGSSTSDEELDRKDNRSSRDDNGLFVQEPGDPTVWWPIAVLDKWEIGKGNITLQLMRECRLAIARSRIGCIVAIDGDCKLPRGCELLAESFRRRDVLTFRTNDDVFVFTGIVIDFAVFSQPRHREHVRHGFRAPLAIGVMSIVLGESYEPNTGG